jgi:hypothetical protein
MGATSRVSSRYRLVDMKMRSLLYGVLCTAVMLPAAAQQNPADKTTRYATQEINFDLWCQETEKLPPERCDRRTPEDEAQFDAYRDAVDKYELKYLKRKQTDQNLSRIVTHADPSPNEDPARHPTDKDIASPKPNP